MLSAADTGRPLEAMIAVRTRQLPICCLALWLCCPGLRAAELPEPLTLEAALATAGNDDHYEVVELEQQMRVIASELGIERGQYGFELDLRGRLSKVGPSDYDPDTPDIDNQAHLILTKPLFDFGLRDSREGYLSLQLLAFESQKQLLIERRRIDILQRYFDVLDADNEFRSENEALAIGFNRYDRARENMELGTESEVEVLRLQTEFETIRQRRSLVMHRQRLTRAMLAEVMGYPGNLPSELERPQIETGRGLPESFESLVERALTHSLEARLADVNSRAAQAAIGIARNTDGPSLELELQVSEYARDSRLRDDWRANLLIDIPLYSAASSDRVDLAQARYRIALANQQQLQSNLRLEVLELWQKIQQLDFEIESATVEQDYRDRHLDRSRAEYELEFKTDLGDSMVLYTRSDTERLRRLYDYELAYQRLGALVGEDFLSQAD